MVKSPHILPQSDRGDVLAARWVLDVHVDYLGGIYVTGVRNNACANVPADRGQRCYDDRRPGHLDCHEVKWSEHSFTTLMTGRPRLASRPRVSVYKPVPFLHPERSNPP